MITGKVDLRFAIRQLQVCRKFTLEFTTIVRTICFVNSNGWSHAHYTIIDHRLRPFVNSPRSPPVADHTRRRPSLVQFLCARVVSGSFTSIVIYQPGAVTSAFFDDLSEVLDRAAGYRDPVYIVGDRNVRLDRADDANSRQLTDLLEAYGFSVRETEMTHARGGILDDVATRRDLTPPHVTVFDVGLSDHHLLQWSVPTIRPPPPVVSCRPVVHRRWRLLDVDTLYTNSSVDITALSARQLD